MCEYQKCKHCIDGKKNEIGETLVFCEIWGEWKNVTLGDCFGNCESQDEVCDDREKLIKVPSRHFGKEIAVAVADWLIENDVVPVVRCKDCKFLSHLLSHTTKPGNAIGNKSD